MFRTEAVSAVGRKKTTAYPACHAPYPPLLIDTKGFDVTGVVTEVDLAFPNITTVCDCIQACLDNPTTCANYVYKFSTPASVLSGYRTCTLYSQFNLPSNVTIDINLNSTANQNIQLLQAMNNPQAGGLVPQAFKDMNLTTVPDDDAVSGCVSLLLVKGGAALTCVHFV